MIDFYQFSLRLRQMKYPRIITIGFSRWPYISKRTSFIHKWSSFKRWQEIENLKTEHSNDKERLKNFISLPTGLYITPELPENVLPKKDRADKTRKYTGALPIELLTNHTQMRYIDHSFDNIRRFKRYQHFQHLQYDQRMIPERLLFLGPDLAAAHFLVHRGATVKFIEDSNWYKSHKNAYNLPGRKIPGLFLEAIDASGTELMFEGFENLHNLNHLRMLRLSDCQYIDDWTLSRIGGMMKSLEMLDLSGCHRITAKGLMGLKSLKNLKYLRLEGIDAPNIGKACLLLEDSIPSLTVLGINYEDQLKTINAEDQLLSHPRIVQDAKGNAFAVDDNNRMFYVWGNLSERPVVCDNDKPIITSTIRREVPSMDDLEFNRIDALSGGKLRHLLLGSPSGYEWNEQVETILKFEAEWNKKDGIPVNPKMLPKDMRPQVDIIHEHKLLEAEQNKFLMDMCTDLKPLAGEEVK